MSVVVQPGDFNVSERRSGRVSWSVALCMGIVGCVLAMVVLGSILAPQDPEAQRLTDILASPSSAHWLGTDSLGRDVLSRLIVGARSAFVGPLVIAAGSMLVGNLLGLISGYFGGAVDSILMRWVDFMWALPGLLVIIVVAGSSLAVLSGLRFVRHAHRAGVPVLILSQYVEQTYAAELLADGTGGVGYLLKDRVSDVDTFTDAVRRVANGGSALDPDVVALLLGRRRREDPLESLTAREREVLGLMAEGRSNNAIAEALVVTERAIEKHVTSIFSKLGLSAADDGHRRVEMSQVHRRDDARDQKDDRGAQPRPSGATRRPRRPGRYTATRESCAGARGTHPRRSRPPERRR